MPQSYGIIPKCCAEAQYGKKISEQSFFIESKTALDKPHPK